MVNEIYLRGKKIRLNPKKSIGKGGEADVFDIGNGLAVKIFKPPDHPDFFGDPEEKKFAAGRIKEHQQKLPQFPRNLPPGVITPQELAYDAAQRLIVGYAMKYVTGADPLIRYSERSFREKGVSNEKMLVILRNLCKLVPAVHQTQAVIGDFNDLNVLVRDEQIFLIDADSFQFGKFPCRTFTDRFVDPLLCDPRGRQLMLIKPHNFKSDWYAFTIMLMQSLLFVGPYGGVYRPKDPRQNPRTSFGRCSASQFSIPTSAIQSLLFPLHIFPTIFFITSMKFLKKIFAVLSHHKFLKICALLLAAPVVQNMPAVSVRFALKQRRPP